MKKSIITGTASVNVLLNDGNSILKEEINTYEMSEETFIANAAIVLDDEQYELELD